MIKESSDLFQAITLIARKEAMKLQAKTKMGTVEGTVKDGIAKVIIDGNETTTDCAALVSASPKDRVLVSLDPATGEPTVIGNKTDPSASSTEAQHVKNVAEVANQLLEIVSDAADQAETTVEQIFIDAAQAGQGLTEIKNYVGMAEEYDKTLTERVEESENQLNSVVQNAEDARQAAERAAESASEANMSASRAESGLARVQDVVGTVNWLEQHANLTEDSEALTGKTYYERNEETGTLLEAVVEVGDSVEGLYELTETVQNYIASYLALVDGVLKLSSGTIGNYTRVEISPEALRFVAPDGNDVASIEVGADGKSVMKITRSVVLEDIQFSNWKLYARRNRNMSLKWVG